MLTEQIELKQENSQLVLLSTEKSTFDHTICMAGQNCVVQVEIKVYLLTWQVTLKVNVEHRVFACVCVTD